MITHLNSQIGKDIFATVQNKKHYVVHGSMEAEVIMTRIDYTKEHMGLLSTKCETKNYLQCVGVVYTNVVQIQIYKNMNAMNIMQCKWIKIIF